MERFDDKFIDDLRDLANNAEKLLAATGEQTGAEILKVRNRLEHSLQNVQGQIIDVERDFLKQAKAAAKTTNRYVHENAWASIGLASLVGIAAGIVIARR